MSTTSHAAVMAAVAVLAATGLGSLGASFSRTIEGEASAGSLALANRDAFTPSMIAPRVSSRSQAGMASAVRKLVGEVVAEMVPIADTLPADEALKLQRTQRGLEEVFIAGYEALPKEKKDRLAGLMRSSKNNRQRQVRSVFLELGPGYQKLGQVLSSRGDLVGPETQRTLASFTDSLPQHFTSSRYDVVGGQAVHRTRLLWDAEQQQWRRLKAGKYQLGGNEWRADTEVFEPVMGSEYERAVRALPELDNHEERVFAAQVAQPLWVHEEQRFLPYTEEQLRALRKSRGLHGHVHSSPKLKPRPSPSLLGTGTVAETYLFRSVDEASAAKLEPVPKVVVDAESELAVKLRKNGVERQLDENLRTMLAGLENAEPEAREAFEPILEDLRFMAMRETDFRHEARAMMRAQKLFSDPDVHVPEALFASDDIVLMTRAPGGNLLENLPEGPAARQKLAANIGADIIEMLEAGFLHGDLHAGNILYDGQTRTYLDWGLYVDLDADMTKGLVRSYLAALSGDEDAAFDALRVFDPTGEQLSDDALRAAVRQAFESAAQPAQAFSAIVMQARLAGLQLPAGVGLAAKSLYQVDGVHRMIDPAFSFAEAAKVYVGRVRTGARDNPLEAVRKLQTWLSAVGLQAAWSNASPRDVAKKLWQKVRRR